MDLLVYEAGSFYIFDRGDVDFGRLYHIHQQQAWFVTRPKTNMNYRRLYSAKADKEKGVKVDQTIKLNNHYAAKDYPGKLRLIKFYDSESGLRLEFITNKFELDATEVALLYKHRWRVELFFKWIKQHLKIKSFWGTSENAVRIQVYTAIIAYTTVAIMRQKLKTSYSNYEILQILSMTLLSKTPVNELFQTNNQQYVKEQDSNQLILF